MDKISIGDMKTAGKVPSSSSHPISTSSNPNHQMDTPISIGNMPTLNEKTDFYPIGIIDRYKLIEQLGAGGFGSVYRARDTVAQVNIALKVLPPVISAVPEEMENVRANFALVQKLKHPNIASLEHLHKVEIPDIASQELLRVFPDSYLVIMEYVKGSTLSNWRKQFPDKKVPFDQAVKICAKVATALDFAHSKQIIHRDIKTSNIIITPDSEVKVLDFGLAAEIRSSMSHLSKEQFDSSGTRPYMAPEQWSGKRQDARTDQYSLAILFYELVSGSVPFTSVFDTGDSMIMMQVVESKTPEQVSGLTKHQNNALLQALSKSPTDRFASCTQFISALQGGELSHRKGRFHIRLTIAVILLLLLGTATWFGYQKYEKNQKVSAERLRQEELPKATRDKISSLKSNANTAEQSGNLAEVSKYVSEIFALDSQDSFAKSAQLRISQKAGITETAPVKSRAEITFNNLSSISTEHGFKAKITDVKAKLKTAETFFNSKTYGDAMMKYQEVINESAKLAKLNSARNLALVAKNRTERAKSNAESANSATLAKSIHSSGETLLADGNAKLAKGDFSGTEKSFSASIKEYEHAKQYAEGLAAVNIVKKQYKNLLFGVNLADLNSYGGFDWAEARVAVSNANSAVCSEDWSAAIDNYKKACKLMPEAVRKAKGGAGLVAKQKMADNIFARLMKETEEFYSSAKNSSSSNTVRFKACENALAKLADFHLKWNNKDKNLKIVPFDYLSAVNKQKIAALKSEIAKLAKTLWDGPKKGSAWTVPDVAMEFVYVKEGTFQMGSNNGADDEKPVHKVRISKPFWIGKYEVTQQEFSKFIQHTNYKTVAESVGFSTIYDKNQKGREEKGAKWDNIFVGGNRPATCISWIDADRFCMWLTKIEREAERLPSGYEYRLPTEAEWEFSARGGIKSRRFKYSGSNNQNEVNWYHLNSKGKTHPVGQMLSNEIGLFDVSGNVSEFCFDLYDSSYYKSNPSANPFGPSKDVNGNDNWRVTRGGNWCSDSSLCTITRRGHSGPIGVANFTGFRVSLSPIVNRK